MANELCEKKALIEVIKEKVEELGWSWQDNGTEIKIGCECEYIYDFSFMVDSDTAYILGDIWKFAQMYDSNQTVIDTIRKSSVNHLSVFNMLAEAEGMIKRLNYLAYQVYWVIETYNKG